MKVHNLVMKLIKANGGDCWESATRKQIADRLRFWRNYKRPEAIGSKVIANSIFPRVI